MNRDIFETVLFYLEMKKRLKANFSRFKNKQKHKQMRLDYIESSALPVADVITSRIFESIPLSSF
jgi:hypothetical protein